ncbi:MAG TPA: hypothetical protein PKJ63_05950 [Cyclobacteriaceae bacterium]|nr:hypothetical protein [Cyclobacteriaceae bacterium]
MKDWKYALYLVIFIGIYVAIQLLSPKSHNWVITLSHLDKNPYGTYVLHEVMPDIFDSVQLSNESFYEILEVDSMNPGGIISFSTSLNTQDEDTDALIKYVSKGKNAFLSAHYFYGQLADTFNISTVDYLFNNGIIDQRDSMELRYTNTTLDTTTSFLFRRSSIHNYFKSYDTLRTTVVARNDMGEAVTIKLSLGKGALYLNSTPLAFTNINLLSKENHQFASVSASLLDTKDLVWTEFYHLGRMEAQTPLRFILSQESLSWAYYLVIGALLLFILFEGKRKQRIIPIIPPLQNTSLEFVSTISNLYYQHADHKNIAEKRIAFFFDQLRSQFNIDMQLITKTDYEHIAAKTGNDIVITTALFKAINNIQNRESISSAELIDINKQMDQFIK